MLILKILAAPFVLALTLLVAVLSFLHSLAAGVLELLALLAAGCAACSLASSATIWHPASVCW